MYSPPQLFVVYDQQALKSGKNNDLKEIKSSLTSRFNGINIQIITISEGLKKINNNTLKSSKTFLLLTNYIMPQSKKNLAIFLSKANQTLLGLIMYPTSVSKYPDQLVAKTIKDVGDNFTKLLLSNQSHASSYATVQSSDTSIVGTNPRPTSSFRSTSNFTSTSNLAGSPKLGIIIFGSDNQIFTHDMNLLYHRYGSDPRVKINQVSNLNQIPIIAGNQYYIFVSDQDANFFIPQLNNNMGRSDRFIPILYNTSRRTIRSDSHFSLSVSDLNRAYAQIDNRLNTMNFISSTGTLPPPISIVSGQVPTGMRQNMMLTSGMANGTTIMNSGIPNGGMMTNGVINPVMMNNTVMGGSIGGITSSHTLIQNPTMTTTFATKYPQLLILDPGEMYFEQFYRMLPIDYKLINHFKQNFGFGGQTVLLAPWKAKEYVLSRIPPNQPNVSIVFYSQNPQRLNHNLVRLVSNNPRQIQQYLRSVGITFTDANTNLGARSIMMRSGTLNQNTMFGRQSRVINGQMGVFDSTTIVNNQWDNWGNGNAAVKQWVVRRFPASHKYETYLAQQQNIYQNRSNVMMNTRMGGSMESNHNFYQIKQIPNQSQVRVNQTILNSPPRNTVINQVTEIERTVIPLQLAQTVTEEVYEQNTISVKNRPQSNFIQEQSLQSITVDQIPIAETVPIPPPPIPPIVEQIVSPRNLSSTSQTITMNIEPTYIPPPVIAPPPTPIPVEVPSITSGYYNSYSASTIPATTTVQTVHVSPSYTPPKVMPSTNVVHRRVVQEDWVDPIKYQKIVEGGRTRYVMRQDYINKMIQDQSYQTRIVDAPTRVSRRSRVLYDGVVKPSYNDIQYVVDSPRIRKSRVLYADIPTTTIISPSTQVLETSFTSPAIDLAGVDTRLQNGITVYSRKSPLRRSNVIVDQYTTSSHSPIHYTTTTTPTVLVNQPQVLRRSFVMQNQPIRTSRVVVQSPQVIEVRRSNSGTRGSRVYRTSTEGEVYINNRPVHLVFKKLNSLLGSTSQYFNDPRYNVHKYYSTNQLAAIANSIPIHEPVVLVVDDIPESIDYFTNHSNFNTVVIPKNRASYRTQQVKYPKYKWILQEDPERAYGEIMTYLDQFAYSTPRTTTIQRSSRAIDDVRYMSPNIYSTGYTSSYNNVVDTKPRFVNSSKKVLLFPVDRSEVKDFVQSRLPNLFDFIPYTDMSSLTKQLDYWPGTNLVVVLSEPLAQQAGTVTRISRNADYIVYDPNNNLGYIKQQYNAIKRVRTVHDLVTQLQDIMGLSAKAEYRRQNRSYQI